MKRNLSIKLITPYGQEFEPSLTLEQACYQAVLGVVPEDATKSGQDKLKLYRLAQKIAKGGVVDFDAEEIALIKERVGRTFNQVAVGAIWDLLEADYAEPSQIPWKSSPPAAESWLAEPAVVAKPVAET